MHSALNPRFEAKKLAKALNFKNFNTGLTRFKRKNLFKWRRLTNGSIITTILKNWIADYSFAKKFSRFNFFDLALPLSFTVVDGLYIKKKTPLVVRQFFYFTQNSSFVPHLRYFFKKFNKSQDDFNFYKNNKLQATSSISTLSNPLNLETADPYIIFFFFKSEKSIYSLDFEISETYNINIIFLTYKSYFINVYRTFSHLLFLKVKLCCHLNYLN